MDPSLDKINTKIPKQVRDDPEERHFRASTVRRRRVVIPKTTHSVMLNLIQHLVLCSQTFQIHGFTIVDAFEERIPKRVRDDNVWDLLKAQAG